MKDRHSKEKQRKTKVNMILQNTLLITAARSLHSPARCGKLPRGFSNLSWNTYDIQEQNKVKFKGSTKYAQILEKFISIPFRLKEGFGNSRIKLDQKREI